MRAVWITTIIVFVIDQITKYGVVFGLGLKDRIAIDVLPPFLNFRMAWNRGVNFGLFAHDADVMRWVLTGLALAISVGVAVWARNHPQSLITNISAGLLIGGAFGNAIDRIMLGAVADFLNMSCCGIHNPFSFNVADIAIFAGAIGLILFAKTHKTP